MRLRTTAAAVGLAVTLSACGSDSGSNDTSTANLPTLCSKLGHSFTEETNEHELYTSDEGACGQLRLYAFDSSNTRDQWLKIAHEFGGAHLVGYHWVIAGDDPSLLDTARTNVGGERR